MDELVVSDAAAWRRWLEAQHGGNPVWLVLARKGTTQPTALTYPEALEEALCFGWIDGQMRRRDATTWVQRFGPRGPRSLWSKRNVSIAEQLMAAGRMQPPGLAVIARAKADGRWAAAYAGARESSVPADLEDALAANAPAREKFERLSAQNRYAVLHRLEIVKRPETRARKIAQMIDMLEAGRTFYPQRDR